MAVKAPVSDCRSRFPIFERLTYINSCSQGALSDSVRAAYDDYLTGWDERGAPWEYWVERAETARSTFARLVGGQPDDVAVTTSLSAGVSALASAIDFERAAEGRDQRLRVPDDRPDLARAGAARRARSSTFPLTAPRSPWSASRRRSTSRPRSSRSPPSATGTARGSPVEEIAKIAHERGALVRARRLPGDRHLSARRRASSASTCSRPGVLKYLLGSAGLGFMWTRPGLVRASCCPPRPAGSPTRTSSRWTSRLLAVADRPPLPVGHAADAVDLRRDRGHRADGGDRHR